MSLEPLPLAPRPTTMPLLHPVPLTALVAALAVVGCSTDELPVSDCTTQIRVGSTVYSSYGFVEGPAVRHASADRADCEDVGEDARGSVFPEDPQQVRTWRFPGFSPDEVVAVRFDERSFEVFIADSLPAGERDRVGEAVSRRRD